MLLPYPTHHVKWQGVGFWGLEIVFSGGSTKTAWPVCYSWRQQFIRVDSKLRDYSDFCLHVLLPRPLSWKHHSNSCPRSELGMLSKPLHCSAQLCIPFSPPRGAGSGIYLRSYFVVLSPTAAGKDTSTQLPLACALLTLHHSDKMTLPAPRAENR